MNITTVLFDLDGTLVPMDQDVFVKDYFSRLAAKMSVCGYEPEALLGAMWQGIKAMIKNDGVKTNEEIFWQVFSSVLGEEILNHMPKFEEFYEKEFDKVKSVCGYNSAAAETVHKIKGSGYRVALATNPLFPSIATELRIAWAGLNPEDFELVTTYEDIGYCKPNIEYYKEVVRRLGVKPEECLMVGNDVRDDMIAEKLGMKVFLLTDCLINKADADISQYPKGSFDELLTYIDSLKN